jgi:hypothetical protein
MLSALEHKNYYCSEIYHEFFPQQFYFCINAKSVGRVRLRTKAHGKFINVKKPFI